MTPSLTDKLCTRCGLCCDGTLFADVELAGRAEPARLAVLGLEIEEGDAGETVLVQPCAGLRGTRCAVYEHRPACCRSFECRLLEDAKRGAVSVEDALERIGRARRLVRRANVLLAALRDRHTGLPLPERAAHAAAGRPGERASTRRRRAELARAMAALQRLIRAAFLRGGQARRAGP